jgi:hypothetical protein
LVPPIAFVVMSNLFNLSLFQSLSFPYNGHLSKPTGAGLALLHYS